MDDYMEKARGIARDVIASAVRDSWKQALPADAVALLIDSRLTAAGYRILGPGEIDRETVERCARLMDDAAEWTFAGPPEAVAVFEDVRELAAAAIRSLASGESDSGQLKGTPHGQTHQS